MDAVGPDFQEHFEWNRMQTVSEAFLTSIVIWPHKRTSGRPKKNLVENLKERVGGVTNGGQHFIRPYRADD